MAGIRIQGVLDFSLVGILSKLSGILAENQIGIFAVSTFNTDYILVKAEDFEQDYPCAGNSRIRDRCNFSLILVFLQENTSK